jgi:hypothetical protein
MENPVSLGYLLSRPGTTKAVGIVSVPRSCQDLNLDVMAQGQRKMARMTIRLRMRAAGVCRTYPQALNGCFQRRPTSGDDGLDKAGLPMQRESCVSFTARDGYEIAADSFGLPRHRSLPTARNWPPRVHVSPWREL